MRLLRSVFAGAAVASMAAARVLLLGLGLPLVAGFGGIEYLTDMFKGQTTVPGPDYTVGTKPKNEVHYDERGHYTGDYPEEYLINNRMVDALSGTTSPFSKTNNGNEYLGDIDGFEGTDVTVGRRLSAADAESALLEAAKAKDHESVDMGTLDDMSLPALMTEI